jgi:hypothetical protein
LPTVATVSHGFFKNLKDGILSGSGGLSDEHLATLTPAQRAAYDAKMAQVATVTADAVQAQVEIREAQLAARELRPLHGPAGDWVYGATIGGLTPDEAASMTTKDLIARSNQALKDGAEELAANPFVNLAPPPAPFAPADGNVERAEQIAIERAFRDAAREPYLAEQRHPVVFSRLATRGKTQIEEVTEYLAASGLGARPDLVYGLYRVPDRISPALGGSENGRVVEWDIVHASTDTLARTAPPVATLIEGNQRLVRRRVGEPSILDEDLGVALLAAAGIGPEQTLGIARRITIHGFGDAEGGSDELYSWVTGMQVFHPAGIGPIQEPAAPIDLPVGPPPGVYVDVLNWGAVAQAVHPRSQRAYTIPSPFPYLPPTPQELMRMYVEVVGLRPNDCYAASVTSDKLSNMLGPESMLGGLVSSDWGIRESLPCADGKNRQRAAGGAFVLFAYRDRPEYEVGRGRWAAYQRDVLQASLENGMDVRGPVESSDFVDVAGIRHVLRAMSKIDRALDIGDGRNVIRDLPRNRYCWPPIDD